MRYSGNGDSLKMKLKMKSFLCVCVAPAVFFCSVYNCSLIYVNVDHIFVN
jgi:hypothetical protein